MQYGNDENQVIEFFGEGPLVALIHGGYWRPHINREHLYELANALTGYRVALIEYRRIPGDPYKTIDDINLAFSKLSEVSVIVGHSVGGYLALLAESDAKRNVLLAPVTDLMRTQHEDLGESAVTAFLNGKAEEFSEIDPFRIQLKRESVIIHGDADVRVPIQHSRDFAKKFDCKLLEVSGGNHFAVIKPEGLAFELLQKSLHVH